MLQLIEKLKPKVKVTASIVSSVGDRYCESSDDGANWDCYDDYRSEVDVYGCQP